MGNRPNPSSRPWSRDTFVLFCFASLFRSVGDSLKNVVTVGAPQFLDEVSERMIVDVAAAIYETFVAS
jgi:hypothetical protein